MHPTLTDDVLADRAGAGDRSALDCLMHRHYEPMLRILRTRFGVEAEDALQNGLLLAVTHLGTFRGGNFGAWCLQIARNNWIGSNRRARPRTADDELVGQTAVDPKVAKPVDRMVRKEEDETLAHCMGQLTARERTIVAAKFGNDVPDIQLAEMFDIPTTRVHGIRFKAIKKLQKCAEKISDTDRE